ncbi:MAG: tetratricopeptide repeat protein [Candidatus Aminicenantes bacterium]|nr:tetratricopeptide repeat protein [Candidatus Aminicenantes bacterium]
MNKNWRNWIIWLVLLLGVWPALAQTAADHIASGDRYYAQFDDQKALAEYQKAVDLEPENYQALWKLARALIDVADSLPPQDKETPARQKKMYSQAEEYARRAVKVNPQDTWGYFYLSAGMGKRALMLGKKEQIEMSRQVKAAIEKALELDPSNDLAYHALGRWHRRMAEIGGVKRALGGLLYGDIPKGSFEEAEKCFKKAIELRPNYTNHYLELGRTYLAMDKKDLARQAWEKCLECPITTSKCELYKKEASEELAKLKSKK